MVRAGVEYNQFCPHIFSVFVNKNQVFDSTNTTVELHNRVNGVLYLQILFPLMSCRHLFEHSLDICCDKSLIYIHIFTQ